MFVRCAPPNSDHSTAAFVCRLSANNDHCNAAVDAKDPLRSGQIPVSVLAAVWRSDPLSNPTK